MQFQEMKRPRTQYLTRSFDGDNPAFLRGLASYRGQIELAHHDIDRLYAESESTLRLLLVLLEAGHVNAAKEIIRRRFGEAP